MGELVRHKDHDELVCRVVDEGQKFYVGEAYNEAARDYFRDWRQAYLVLGKDCWHGTDESQPV